MKKKWLKRIGIGLGVLFVVLIIIVVVVLSIIGGSNADEIKALLDEKGVVWTEETVSFGEERINVIKVGDTAGEKVLLIHGSPGEWSAWENILIDSSLQDKCLLAFDRPGYGLTTIEAFSDLADQASVAHQVLEHYLKPGEKAIVVGHSYGGGVALRLGLDFPEKVQRLVLVAPTVSPEHQPTKWYNHLLTVGWVNSLMPENLQSSNHEMMGLRPSLESQERRLATLPVPVIFIHGTDDMLVPFESVDYFRENVSQNVQFELIEGMNHFTPWSRPELIIEAILGPTPEIYFQF